MIRSTRYEQIFNWFLLAGPIQFMVSEQEFVTLNVYNHLGQEVTNLVNALQSAGRHDVTWNASNHPSGLYFYKMETGDYSETKKLVLQK